MILLEQITLKCAEVQFFDAKLIRVEILNNAFVGKRETDEIIEAIGILAKGKKSLVMVVANELSWFTRDAITCSVSGKNQRRIIGEAFVIKPLAQRITAGIYLKFRKTTRPGKIFSGQKEALRWLFSLEEELVLA